MRDDAFLFLKAVFFKNAKQKNYLLREGHRISAGLLPWGRHCSETAVSLSCDDFLDSRMVGPSLWSSREAEELWDRAWARATLAELAAVWMRY